MIRLLAEVWGLLALAFIGGGSLGWGFAALLRPVFEGSGDDWRDPREDEPPLALPVPAPLALAPPRGESGSRVPAVIEGRALEPVPRQPAPRRAPRPSMFRPPALAGPRNGRADALQRLPGTDRVIVSRLYGIGVYHFSQIAAWTPQELAWVGAHLDIGDLPVREDWVGAATRLAIADRPTRPPRV